MRTDDFDFILPGERIALRPLEPRSSARLLVVDNGLHDRVFAELSDFLRPDDLLVFNDTRVIPSRLIGRKGEGRIEVTLHRHTGEGIWRAFARPARRLAPGTMVEFAEGLRAHVTQKLEGGEVELDFGLPDDALLSRLHECGIMPLPPYIAGKRPVDERDVTDYQTIYAEKEGAVAAPTAGLHFDRELLADLKEKDIATVNVTLHVGAGTFLPVTAEKIEEHRMHAEFGEISAAAAEAINESQRRGGRVVAVGTTALRLLESAATEDGEVEPFSGETDIFITPGFEFRVVDMLITNFHLPRSTLFMLVCAFAGMEEMRAAYSHAIEAGYRFYSYGDASLLYRR